MRYTRGLRRPRLAAGSATRCIRAADRSSSQRLFSHCQYFPQAKSNAASLHNPDDPFNQEESERLQVEALAKKFENKYVSLSFAAR